MAFVPIPNCVRVAMRYEQQGQKVENIYHVVKADAWDVPAMQSCADIFHDWQTITMQQVQTANLKYQSCSVTSLQTEFAPGIEDTQSAGTGGIIGTSDLPMNVTVAVRWLTGIRGRSFRGRTYHLGLPLSWITASRLVDSVVPTLISSYNALTGMLEAAGYNLAVASYRFNNADRNPGIATVITGIALDQTLDSQRRRLPGRGN